MDAQSDLVELVREVYPLIARRHVAPVTLLRAAHERLTWYALERGRDPEDWPDMALRVMLEYERAA